MLAEFTSLSSGATPGAEPSFLFILGDDIGWADFSYNNGTAKSPNIRKWTETAGTVVLQDFHTGGTVCSPTRATVLTGRNHFRDCVDYVYGCSDMTECVPKFNFAPQNTFTIGDAATAAPSGNYDSWFGGKWHLGSLYNDSEKYGGITSSPISHGFAHMNATVEVAPTATTNCECNEEWQKDCDYGHYGKMTHCNGGQGPDPNSSKGCCFNYWWEDKEAEHGITNLTNASPDDDATYNAESFLGFLDSRQGKPFLAQISFHNCHIPFIGTHDRRAACTSGAECEPVLEGAAPYTDEELDFYACLNEFDNSVGTVLDRLKELGYYENTMIWFTVDNGPEVNCKPEGRCGSGKDGKIPPGTLHRPDSAGAGSAGPLRGRKRDVWEGGHRVPGIISWPAVAKGPARVSWDTVVTMDFLATVMEVLKIERPESQAKWYFDGISVLPILKQEHVPERGIGWIYDKPVAAWKNGYAYRWGKWKYVVGGISCDPKSASFDCSAPQLYNMDTDFAEEHDLAKTMPDVLAAGAANFSAWFATIQYSIANESKCSSPPSPTPHPTPFPAHPTPSSACAFSAGYAQSSGDIAVGHVASQEECCGACVDHPGCVASDYKPGTPIHPTWNGMMSGGACHLKSMDEPKVGGAAAVSIVPSKMV
jgi:arylsulfatase A-like enzyme